jgi:hypothetical protein
MADCGLTLIEPLAESRHMSFALLHQVQQDAEASFIRQELEDLDQFVLQLLGDVRKSSGNVGLGVIDHV